MLPTPAEPLFCETELGGYLQQRRLYLQQDVDQADEAYLLGTDSREWAAFLRDKHQVTVPALRPEEVVADDEGEVKVDVSHEHMMRAISGPSRPTYIPGRRVVVHIPFEGEGGLFMKQPSHFSTSPPRAIVGRGELRLVFDYPHDRRPNIKTEIDGLVSAVERYLEWQRSDVHTYNAHLESEALHAIEARRERVMADHAHIESLGIPVRRRDDAPQTYAAPGITRKPAPKKPRERPEAPRALEPTLVDDFYEHICQLTRSMGHSMERTPEGYAGWEEERLRDALLVMLNSFYEGQAMGEVFQGAGKTDILVRIQDRNVFVAECKWWSGQAAFVSALDQLFSYTTWRDTKLALVLFVRAKTLTNIIAKGREALEAHPQFKVFQDEHDETELRAAMTWPGDPGRVATLNVFFFHLGANTSG